MAVFDNIEKPVTGGGQHYDESNMFYDQIIDLDTSSEGFYDGLGGVQTWANISKT